MVISINKKSVELDRDFHCYSVEIQPSVLIGSTKDTRFWCTQR